MNTNVNVDVLENEWPVTMVVDEYVLSNYTKSTACVQDGTVIVFNELNMAAYVMHASEYGLVLRFKTMADSIALQRVLNLVAEGKSWEAAERELLQGSGNEYQFAATFEDPDNGVYDILYIIDGQEYIDRFNGEKHKVRYLRHGDKAILAFQTYKDYSHVAPVIVDAIEGATERADSAKKTLRLRSIIESAMQTDVDSLGVLTSALAGIGTDDANKGRPFDGFDEKTDVVELIAIDVMNLPHTRYITSIMLGGRAYFGPVYRVDDPRLEGLLPSKALWNNSPQRMLATFYYNKSLPPAARALTSFANIMIIEQSPGESFEYPLNARVFIDNQITAHGTVLNIVVFGDSELDKLIPNIKK